MKNYILLIPFTVILLLGCEGKEGMRGPAGLDGAYLTGDMVGAVQVNDTTALRFTFADVSIRLEGTNYSAVSDSEGIWKIKGVRTGTYIITASMEGYSVYKNTSFQFVGGDQPAYAGMSYLYKQPNVFVKEIVIAEMDDKAIRIKGFLSSNALNSSYAAIVFVAIDSINKNITDRNTIFNLAQHPHTVDTFSVKFYLSTLKSYGANKGSKVYFVSFVSSYAGYFDYVKREYVYAGLAPTPSNVIGLIIP